MVEGWITLTAWIALTALSACCAADACLRLVPLMGELHAGWSRRPAAAEPGQPFGGVGQVPQLAGDLAGICVVLWIEHMRAAQAVLKRELLAGEQLHQRAAGVGPVAAGPLWQLHSTVVRLIHWAAAQRSQCTPENQPDYPLPALVPVLGWDELGRAAVDTLQLAVMAGQQAVHKAALNRVPEEQRRLLVRCALGQAWGSAWDGDGDGVII